MSLAETRPRASGSAGQAMAVVVTGGPPTTFTLLELPTNVLQFIPIKIMKYKHTISFR